MNRDDLELFERSLRHATDQHTGKALDATLDELGWGDALATDPQVAVSMLFDLQGRANVTSSALGALVVDRLGVDAGAGVLLPALGTWHPPGALDGESVSVRGVSTAATLGAPTTLVVVAAGDTEIAATIPTVELSVRAVAGIDPSVEVVDVTGEAPVGELGPVDWSAAVRWGQLAVSHELLGASRTMLDLARQHALERIQFGKPIASFQAVRHRLAETLVAIETADGVLRAAWEDDASHTAAMAKALAGRGARTAARHCQQVLAGIGFTTEHPFHRYLRRILVLDELFGSARALTKELGHHLIRTRQLPPLLPL
jgi:hypothetical protein